MVVTIELTEDGRIQLVAEKKKLIEIERPEVIEQLKAARAQGDLSENADYDAARNKQAEVEARIKEIDNILSAAKIVKNQVKSDKTISLGSSVTIKNCKSGEEKDIKIVGTVEADPFRGFVSNQSPVGIALLGHKVGDVVLVKAKLPFEVEIIKVIK
ncbi:MAG: transcription elongation factor GreA [Bacilli bacterium]|jgi:transcription elongation factor GreA